MIEQYGMAYDDEPKKQAVSGHVESVVMCSVPVELLKAVAHIGIDFGYGKYELEQNFIDEARLLYYQYEEDPMNT